MMIKRAIFPVFVILALMLAAGQCGAEKEDYPEAINFKLPKYPGRPGEMIELSRLAKGRITVISFFGRGGGQSFKQIPILKSVVNEYSDKGVHIVGVSVRSDNVKKLGWFMNQLSMDYPVGTHGGAKVAQDYGLGSTIPSTVFLTKDFKIFKKFLGFQTEKTLETALKELVEYEEKREKETSIEEEDNDTDDEAYEKETPEAKTPSKYDRQARTTYDHSRRTSDKRTRR